MGGQFRIRQALVALTFSSTACCKAAWWTFQARRDLLAELLGHLEFGGVRQRVLEIRMLSTEGTATTSSSMILSFRSVTVAGPPPRLDIERVFAGDAIELSWLSATNQLYQVQWTADLGANQWFSLGAQLPGTGTTILVTNAIENNAQRFYRVFPSIDRASRKPFSCSTTDNNMAKENLETNRPLR